jgi:hypothetical protein
MKLLLILFLLLPHLTNASISDYSPVAHWDLDEESGVRYDSTDNANNLSDINTVGYTSGLLDNAALLQSSNSEYFSASDASLTNFEIGNSDFTFSAWVNFTSFNPIDHIFTKNVFSTGKRGYTWDIISGDTMRLYLSPNGSNQYSTSVSGLSLSTSTWYHLAVTFDNSSRSSEFFVNGVSQGTDSNSNITTIYNNSESFIIGAQTSHSRYINAAIDHATIFHSIVDPSILYNSGSPLSFSGQSTATSTPLIILPYNENMPQVTSVSASGTDYVINYATSTMTYLNLQNFFILLLIFAGIVAIFAYLTNRFL